MMDVMIDGWMEVWISVIKYREEFLARLVLKLIIFPLVQNKKKKKKTLHIFSSSSGDSCSQNNY